MITRHTRRLTRGSPLTSAAVPSRRRCWPNVTALERCRPTDGHASRRSAPEQGRGDAAEQHTVSEGAEDTPGRGGTECEWEVRAVATTDLLRCKWEGLLPEWSWTTSGDEGWPLCLVGKGNDMAEVIGRGKRTPEWVIVDGGELHKTAVQVLQARHLKKVGSQRIAQHVGSPRGERP
jgi:hypothetical protein